MDRRELLEKLRELKPWLESRGVVDLRLFGSFARDEANEDSDVDLIAKFGWNPGLDMFSLEHELGVIIGRPVELFTERCLRPLALQSAERDAIHV